MLRGIRFAPLVSLRYARVRTLRVLGGSSSQKWEPVNLPNLTLPPQRGKPLLPRLCLTSGLGFYRASSQKWEPVNPTNLNFLSLFSLPLPMFYFFI